MKIRIAIIEDEFFTRQAIKKYIGQLGAPYEVCGEADNGREGLELLRKDRPEIALVDITMPVMNGIDMIQEAVAEGLTTQMIILTGYSEFSYARAAVHLGVREYLLKPLRVEDLKSALEHILKSMDQRVGFVAPAGLDMKNLLGCWLAEQLTRSGADSVDTGLLLEHLSFPRNTGVYHVVLIQAHTGDGAAILNRLFTMAQDALRKNGFPAIGYSADNRSLCLVINTPPDVSKSLSDTLRQLTETMYSRFEVQLKVAMSTACNDLSMIPDAYLEAETVQHYYLFCDSRHVAFYTVENTVRKPSILFDADMRHNLTLLLCKQDATDVKAFIEGCFQRIDHSRVSSDEVYLCAADMLSTIFEYSASRFEDVSDLSAPKNALPALFSINHVDSIRKFIVDRAMEAIRRNSSDDNAYLGLVRKVHR